MKKKDSIFLKIFFENEFLKDMEIYQKKTNWRVRGTLTIMPQVRIEYEMIDSQQRMKRPVGYNHLISNKHEWNNNCFIKNAHKILRILPYFICKNNRFSACF